MGSITSRYPPEGAERLDISNPKLFVWLETNLKMNKVADEFICVFSV